MTFRIAQISDTHLSEDKPFFVDSFRRLGAALRADRPDLVLNSGDISLDGSAQEGDLAKLPENGWSLYGLSRALALQGKRDEAAEVRARFEAVWKDADVKITSSCFCQPGK